MRLLGNSLWNLLGGVIPAIAAMATVPLVVSRLGDVHYGLLTLVTSIVGYFALLDINATQGSVKFLAEFRSRNDSARIRQLFSLGIGLYLVIGLAGGAGIAAFAEPLATRVFNVPPPMQDMAVKSLWLGGVAFAFTQVQLYLLSIPQSLHRFDVSARSEAVFGSLASVSTVVIVLLGGGLVEIVAGRAAIAAANVAVLARTVRGLLPELGFAWPSRDIVRDLMGFSFYSYLTRFATVTYANADKLLIAAFVDMRALAMYSVPFLLANRLFSLTYRLGQVMLPEASRLEALGEHEQLRRKYLTSARYLVFLNAALCCLLVVIGRELLHHWAGPSFGADAALVLVLVATAAWIDSFTNVPSLVNDGMGRPANTGVFAALRAVVGLATAWLAVRSFGIVGVAWAQLLVSGVMSFSFLAWVHARVLPATLGEFVRTAVVPGLGPFALALTVFVTTYGHPPMSMAWMFGSGALAVVLLAVYAWAMVLQPEQRLAVSAVLQSQWHRLLARGV